MGKECINPGVAWFRRVRAIIICMMLFGDKRVIRRMKVASWNMNCRNLQNSHVELFERLDLDLLLLQEVKRPFINALIGMDRFGDSVYSMDLVSPEHPTTKARTMGCAIFVKKGMELIQPTLLNDLPFPERSVVAHLSFPGTSLTVCSFHTPPGASWKRKKPESHVKLALWLAEQQGKVILGIDANAPKVDHPDITKNVWWWPEEQLLLGSHRIHPLVDVYRNYLENHPDQFAAIKEKRPDGPLAISHMRGRGDIRIPCRYDFIYASQAIHVMDARYLDVGGSDHNVVYSELAV